MRGFPDDAAEVHRSRLLRVERIGDVVLQKLAGSPCRDIEEAVVEREVDVADQWRDRLETFQDWRQIIGIGRLSRDLDHLLRLPCAAVLVPGPDRGAEILQAGDDANEAERLARIMRRAQLEHHLLFGAEVDHLAMAALGQIPDVQLMTVAALEEDLGIDAVLDHLGRAPLAADHGVVTEVPPEVIGEILRATVELPAAADLEGVVIHDEDPADDNQRKLMPRCYSDSPEGTAKSKTTGVSHEHGRRRRVEPEER